MEIWKEVDGYDGFYMISNYGRVKSTGGQAGNTILKPRIRKLKETKDGYLAIRLNAKGKDKTYRVHRLVAEYFIPNPENKPTVNHIDGVKTNNHVDNLEWATREEQMQHAYDLGLKTSQVGSDNTNAKLTDDDVRYIRKHYKPYSREFGTVALAKKFGVTNSVIGLVARGLSYTNVK